MTKSSFRTGLSNLLDNDAHLLVRSKVALISHQAAVDADGTTGAILLSRNPNINLINIQAPEHGYFGIVAAGKSVNKQKHPQLDIPMYSLYGKSRQPTAHMLKNVDTLIIDIQDLAARCYTYSSTLRLAMEVAAKYNKRVIVCDRPLPLPNIIDGPMLDPRFESFVGMIPTPLCYGMTQGETALYLKDVLNLNLDLYVSKMKHYDRTPYREPSWPPWIPPSPGIKAWESAYCYLATVFSEALPVIDNARHTALAFRVFGAPWLKNNELISALMDSSIKGAMFHPCNYIAGPGIYQNRSIKGVRITVTDPNKFHPVSTSIFMLSLIKKIHRKALWKTHGARPDFFDKLYGTDSVRTSILDKLAPEQIIASWTNTHKAFTKNRKKYLLYKQK